MTLLKLRSAVVALLLFSGAAYCGAATVTVGPTGMYQDPCVAFAHLADGDTVTIDANGGTPYYETVAEGSGGSGGTCFITNNNLTISGINGRPIIDGSQANVAKGMWIVNGHDIVINNIEFRGATNASDDTGADGLRFQASNGHGPTAPGGQTPNGGNITIENSYFLSNDQGLLTSESGISPKTGMDNGEWYSASPYFTFQYDEFAYNGVGANSVNATQLPGHNFYIGHDWNEAETFTLQYSWTHDDLYGHEIRDRAPISNIYYNIISDTWGQSSFMIDVPNGGSTYIVGNVVYKTVLIPSAGPYANAVIYMAYRESSSSAGDPGVYSRQDLHFVNNTVIDDSDAGPGTDVAFMLEECTSGAGKTDQTQCPAPIYGPPLTTPGVFENNIFIGYPTQVTNDLAAYTAGEITYLNTQPTDANMAALHFANPDALDFHIMSGSSAIGAGIYPPTDNTGATDMNAYAQYQYAPPFLQGAARPTPGGSTMDAGAFSYPPPSSPSLSLNISPSTISTPGTGTITVSGLPTPPAGSFNYAVPISGNSQIVTAQSGTSSTTSVTMPYQAIPGITSTTVVPINVYADGGIVSGNLTVNPGPPAPYQITQDGPYQAGTTVHLEGPAPAGGEVVTLSASADYMYIPSSVTVPAGQISAETGSMIGTVWGQSPTHQTVTVTANSDGQQIQVPIRFPAPGIHAFQCLANPCAAAVGGQPYTLEYITAAPAPYGGEVVQITSNNTAVIPNTQLNIAQDTDGPPSNEFQVNTNAVSSPQSVVLTASYNGATVSTRTITVNPGDAPASVTVVSGSGQSANTGTPFSNPLVVVVKDSGGSPLSGVLVTFSGTNVSFPSGNTATTGSNGEASVTAEPTATGSLTIDGTVSGVGTPAVFSETGTSPVAVSSITHDTMYGPGTTVHLTAAAPTGGAVVTLSSSDSSVGYIPASVTVPAGQTSAEDGSFLGSLWGQSPTHKSVTFTATYNGTAQITLSMASPHLLNFNCPGNNCTVTGGDTISMTTAITPAEAPYGGATETITSSNTAVIPNQSLAYNAGQSQSVDGPTMPLVTNAVSTTTSVTVTAAFNGSQITRTFTVNP